MWQFWANAHLVKRLTCENKVQFILIKKLNLTVETDYTIANTCTMYEALLPMGCFYDKSLLLNRIVTTFVWYNSDWNVCLNIIYDVLSTRKAFPFILVTSERPTYICFMLVFFSFDTDCTIWRYLYIILCGLQPYDQITVKSVWCGIAGNEKTFSRRQYSVWGRIYCIKTRSVEL